jgi:hypothetical protein
MHWRGLPHRAVGDEATWLTVSEASDQRKPCHSPGNRTPKGMLFTSDDVPKTVSDSAESVDLVDVPGPFFLVPHA